MTTRTSAVFLIAPLACTLVAWSAAAQTPELAPAEPTPLQRTLEKLRALQARPAPPSATQHPIPGWQILRSQDAMSDLVEYDAVQTTAGGTMVVFCAVTPIFSLGIAFHTTTYMGDSSKSRDATFRVDNAPAVEVSASSLSDKSVTIRSEKLLKAVTASDAKRLLIRLRTWDYKPVDLAFDISGVVSVTERLRDLCTRR